MKGKNEKKKKIQLKRVYPFHIVFFKEPFIYFTDIIVSPITLKLTRNNEWKGILIYFNRTCEVKILFVLKKKMICHHLILF